MNHFQTVITQAAALIQQRIGLDVRAQFRSDLASILSEQSRALGGRGDDALDAYLRRLRSTPETEPIWQTLIEALTIGETYFMRDPAQFGVLRDHLLPGLVERRRAQGKRFLNLWSAGCATGEEPYSIAITLADLLPDPSNWTVRLFGTDINARSLAFAERGVYRSWSFRHSETLAGGVGLRTRYFTPLNLDTGARWELRSELRERVTFRHANLLSGAPLPQLDVIFCRNVLIYIEDARVEALEDMFFNALVPGGWLFLGHAEALHARRERWVSHIFPGTVIYQKPERRGVTGTLKHAQRQPLTEGGGSLTPAPHREREEEPERRPTYTDAIAALSGGDAALAERLLAQVLAHEPGNAQAHTLLAALFANRQALPEAHAHLDAAVRVDPLRADAHYMRGVVYLEEGETDRAITSLNRALYCEPEHVLALFTLAGALQRGSEPGRARREWERARRAASRLDPEAPVSVLSDFTPRQMLALIDGYLST